MFNLYYDKIQERLQRFLANRSPVTLQKKKQKYLQREMIKFNKRNEIKVYKNIQKL